MWFGTAGGISYYDGTGFKNFTTEDGLAHNSVHAVYQDKDGVMWLGTSEGVSRYDGRMCWPAILSIQSSNPKTANFG